MTRACLTLTLAVACALPSGCRAIPTVRAEAAIAWPAEWQARDRYAGPGVDVLATTPRNAALAIERFEELVADVHAATDVPLGPGLLFVVGEDDEMSDIELDAILDELILHTGPPGSRPFASPPRTRDGTAAEPPPLRDALRMVPMPLHVPALLTRVDWHPEHEPEWALMLPTLPATEDAFERMLDARMETDGASLAQRLLAPFAIGPAVRSMRRTVFTPALVVAAFPNLSDKERAELLRAR